MNNITLLLIFVLAVLTNSHCQTDYIYYTGEKLISSATNNCQEKVHGTYGYYVDIAITPDNRIFVTGNSLTGVYGIFEIDTINKTENFVCLPHTPWQSAVGGVGLVALDNEYLLGDGMDSLYKIKIATGEAECLGHIGYYCFGDFAFFKGNLFMSSTNNDLIKIKLDPITKKIAQVTNIGHMSDNYEIFSLFTTFTDCQSTTKSLFVIENSSVFEVDVTNANLTFRCSLDSSVVSNGAASRYDFEEISYPDLLGPDTALCEGETFEIKSNPDLNLSNYLWNNGSTQSSILITQTGTYTLTANSICGTIADSIHIEFLPRPSNDLGNDSSYCQGSGLRLFASDTTYGNYLWSDQSDLAYLDVDSAGTYWLTISNGLCAVTDTIIISEETMPIVDFGADITLCQGQIFHLEPVNIQGTLIWQDGSTGPFLEGSESGTYWLKITNKNCSSTDSIQIRFIDISFSLGPDTTICAEKSFVLKTEIDSATYLWSDLSDDPQLIISQNGNYWLILSKNGCSYSDSIQVIVEDCPVNIVLPDFFTPNSDGINDLFLPIELNGIIQYEIFIVNRWGNLVFQASDPNIPWDGRTNSGQIVSDGVYFWVVNYTDYLENSKSTQGYLHILTN